MFASSISKRFAPVAMSVAMAASFLATACSDMQVNASGGYNVASGNSGSQSCDAARLSAWFQRQRELTDGDTSPSAVIKVPAECVRKTASNDDKCQRQPTDGDTSPSAVINVPAECVRRTASNDYTMRVDGQ